MPLAGWTHPITGERVPLDYFDYDVSCDGRPAFSPALARAAAVKAHGDERHRTLNLTATRCLTCPRQTFLSTLFPYYPNPRKYGLAERSTLLHEGLAKSWNPAVYFAEGRDNTVLQGKLFGVDVSLQLDVLKFARDVGTHDDPSVPPRIVEIGDNKFGKDWSAAYRDSPRPGEARAGVAKWDHALQLNIIRLVLAQQEWALRGGYDANSVLLTIYDYAESRTDGLGVPLAAPHLSEEQLRVARPAVRQSWEKNFDQVAFDRAATVEEIVKEHVWAQWRYSQIPEGLRRERAMVEQAVAPMALIGQRGMFNGKMCTDYCDVKDECDALVRKYGAKL